MAAQIASLGTDDALLEDDYGFGARRRKGKVSGKHRRKQGDKKRRKAPKHLQRSARILNAMRNPGG